jgi:hypothetical protein
MSKTRILTLACTGLFGLALLSGAAAQRFDQIVTFFFHGAPQVNIADNNGTWALWGGGNFHIRQGNADRVFINGGNMVTSFAGQVVAPGFQTASSRTGKTAIRPLGEAEARDALVGLRAVSYRRTDDPTGQSMLGFIAEDVPALLATPSRDALSAMDFTAVTVTVLQAQQREIAQLRAEIAALKAAVRQ